MIRQFDILFKSYGKELSQDEDFFVL